MTGSRDFITQQYTDAYRAQDRKIHTNGDTWRQTKDLNSMHVLCIRYDHTYEKHFEFLSCSRFHCSSSRSIALLTLACSLASMSGEQQVNAISPSTFYLPLAFTIIHGNRRPAGLPLQRKMEEARERG